MWDTVSQSRHATYHSQKLPKTNCYYHICYTVANGLAITHKHIERIFNTNYILCNVNIYTEKKICMQDL